MSIVEPQESIEVTANSGALPGLDNSVAQLEERSTPERGTAPGTASESGDPQHEAPDSSDRACEGSLPVTVSEQENRRLRSARGRGPAEGGALRARMPSGSYAEGVSRN